MFVSSFSYSVSPVLLAVSLNVMRDWEYSSQSLVVRVRVVSVQAC